MIKRAFLNVIKTRQKREIIFNLKTNWFFPVSAMAFFCLSLDNSLGYLLGMPLALCIMAIISTQISSLWNVVNCTPVLTRVFCGISAIGIVLGNQSRFYQQTLKLMLPEKFDTVFLLLSYTGALFAFYFVYICLIFFWKNVLGIFKQNQIFSDITKPEKIIYISLFVFSLIYMIFSFTQSQAFYGTEYLYDIIYTSDSPTLVKGNAYLALTHPENDLRQPLFAVFTAPFVAVPYLLGRLFSVPHSIHATLINSVQIAMIFVANFILAKMMHLDSIKRICFVSVATFTYTQLLFTLMMEQYIITYFWLSLCIYLISENNNSNSFALIGAGGTMLTSTILLPFLSEKSPVKNFKGWFNDTFETGVKFLVFLLAFCRFDVIFYLTQTVSTLANFTGRSVSFTDKLNQYTTFIENCFVAPNACVNTTAINHISWQMNTIDHISFIGIAILFLVIVSALLNRHKRSSILAIVWCAFSFVVLVGLGWGTKENGLILYSLYFGWAYLVLLFQLVEKFETKIKVKILVPVVSVSFILILATINIPSIKNLLDFAITHFPV